MTVAYPINRAWISTGHTGAQNYDEFAEDREITEIIARNPVSALAVEMPHLAPASLGKTFIEALPDAASRLQDTLRTSFRPHEDVVAIYRLGPGSYGVFCLVGTDQISTNADEPGLVIRNEDVFIEKVRERVALAESVGHLLSPVLLLQSGKGAELHALLEELTGNMGSPAVTDTDQNGREHAVWVLGPGPDQDEVLALAGGGELIVADGNHRSLAAQTGGLPKFLAVVTTPESIAIQPYNRLLLGPVIDIDKLRALGAEVVPAETPITVPATGGSIVLYAEGKAHSVTLPSGPGAELVQRLDHALVERVIFNELLGLDAGDKRINYVGGDYSAAYLQSEVDEGRATAAILVAPVTVDDFVAVNLSRLKLPRKSTWFTPKARGGLVLTELPK
ncbi:DUF1015 family protein [Longispora albida]|uniref:DUF1015 family protein n=1 Tax=Longispora albida TaxID=203523 RepID=UPI000371521C|nr:DUF1015 family protein [Longispora albida]